MPSIWLSFVYLFIKDKFLKKITIIFIFVLLTAPSLPIVSTNLEKSLYINLNKNFINDKRPSYIMVLGAGADGTGKYPTTQSLKRAELAIKLSKKYSVPLIFSGGLDAEITPNFFDLSGISYIKEVESENTYDSVMNLKEIVESSEDIILLVTSPIHYKRAILTFKNHNFNIKISNNYDVISEYDYSLVPKFSSISNFNNSIYEIVAIIWYYCSGKI